MSPGETYLECWLQLWSSQYERDIDIMEKVQQGTKRIMKGSEYAPNEGRMGELGLFSLGERRAQDDLTQVYKYLRGMGNEE